MIYYRQKIDNFNDGFENHSIIVLLSENYNLLQKDSKKISEAIAGSNAYDEMRITKYFNQEINVNRDEILSRLRTKSFFPGRQVIMLNGLSEKDHKIITAIDSEWQSEDAITIVTMDKLSKNSELKKKLVSSTQMALITYTGNRLDSDFLKNKLAEDGINLDGDEVLDTLVEFTNFSSEDILENEIEKLKVFKLYDESPLTTAEFFDVVSINYAINELSLAVRLADRNIIELEKSLSIFFSQSKNPITILQFVRAYFQKLYLIKLYGPNSYNVRREYPFLIANDLEKAKIHEKRWSAKQLSIALNSLTIADLRLRKYSSSFQRSILTQCLRKIVDI